MTGAGVVAPASVFELLRPGIGPSSSHTVAPMRAGSRVADRLARGPLARLRVTLHGSLALTGRGHGTHRALVAGLAGHDPATVEPALVSALDPAAAVVAVGPHRLARNAFAVVERRRGGPPGHPNAMRFEAWGVDGALLLDVTFRSIGGGFLTEDGVGAAPAGPARRPYASASELRAHAAELGSVAAVALANAGRPAAEAAEGILLLARLMAASIDRGVRTQGELPGGLGVRRRAPGLRRALEAEPGDARDHADEWVALWAIAVNEENAAGGRIVTAPTNGAAGVLPAVLRGERTFAGLDDPGAVRFLAAAAAVGALIKHNASISGAEVGCQGEVGSAAAMAAAGMAEVRGGTPDQVLNAAEIALEHHLGMTCDPIAGLVQVPCIERNAMGALKARAAAKLALRGDGRHLVSLDHAIDAMRRTGRDMRAEYKETSLGGLAVSVPEC